MGAQSHTLGCAGLLFTPSRRQPCHVSPPGAEAGDMAALARSVLVTGSNRGIGLELVRQLAASPWPPQHIFATCRDPKGPRGKALQELAAQHSSIKLVQLDTVNLPSIRRAMRAVGYHLKDQGLNLLINNAGISSHATLCSLDLQEMLDVFATNVVGPLQVVKVCLDLSCFSCLGRSSLMGKRTPPWISPAYPEELSSLAKSSITRAYFFRLWSACLHQAHCAGSLLSWGQERLEPGPSLGHLPHPLHFCQECLSSCLSTVCDRALQGWSSNWGSVACK
ncbi:3-oxoacyl-[acyl-carrier-protein] reductase MabA-like isoform X1 [Anomalospiza imberbis]|uniref:3-oxoacyl-[acyl-carrier-protein] reductase MabA-like isoform X1 n=1 Tax=Anomalospiza imberbis TaxID=187417 RepID=UPI0035901F27